MAAPRPVSIPNGNDMSLMAVLRRACRYWISIEIESLLEKEHAMTIRSRRHYLRRKAEPSPLSVTTADMNRRKCHNLIRHSYYATATIW